MASYNLNITGQYNPIYTPNNQVFFIAQLGEVFTVIFFWVGNCAPFETFTLQCHVISF